MTLKEKLLHFFTEEEIADLKLNEGITLDMEIKNTEISDLREYELLIGDGISTFCKDHDHNWEELFRHKGTGKRRCRMCLQEQVMKFYIWTDTKS